MTAPNLPSHAWWLYQPAVTHAVKCFQHPWVQMLWAALLSLLQEPCTSQGRASLPGELPAWDALLPAEPGPTGSELFVERLSKCSCLSLETAISLKWYSAKRSAQNPRLSSPLRPPHEPLPQSATAVGCAQPTSFLPLPACKVSSAQGGTGRTACLASARCQGWRRGCTTAPKRPGARGKARAGDKPQRASTVLPQRQVTCAAQLRSMLEAGPETSMPTRRQGRG